MRDSTLIWLGFALLLAAAAMLLWRHAVQTQARRRRRDFLARHIKAAGDAPPAAAPRWQGGAGDAPYASADAQSGGDEGAASLAARLADSPWMQGNTPAASVAAGADASAGAAASSSAPATWMPALPDRLEGVVTAKTLGLVLGAMLLLSLLVAALAGPLAAGAALSLQLLLGVFVLWWRMQALRRQLVRQLPGFIDSVVRLITIGNSTQASFQMAIESTRQPLQACMERAATLVRAGMDLDRALQQVAAQMKVEELLLLASILGLGVRYGGRADLLLERVAAFMRDQEQAEHELMAMSAETRMSAWVLGLLPVAVGAMIIVINPGYFLRMWQDASGQWMVFGAVGLQLLGVAMLYRLARLT